MRCSRCVLPHRTPNIIFDENGVCNYCRTYQPFRYRSEAELLKRLDRVRKTGRGYDCLLGLSGGRDSTYALLKLVKDYGMRALVVNYENPFTDPQAKANIQNALRTLNVDIVRLYDRGDAQKKAFRTAVRAWFKKPSAAMIPIVCLGCKPVWRQIYQVARANNIRCIISGGNPFEVISFKRELVGIPRDEDPARAFFKYVYSLRGVVKNTAYLHPRLILAMAKAYLYGNPRSIGLRLYGRGLTWIELYEYVPWDEERIVSRISDELGWRHPPELTSTWRFDCRVHHLVDFMYMKTLGMTDADDFYAKMVREGAITREAALSKAKNASQVHMDQVKVLLRQAGFEDVSFLKQFDGATGAVA